MIPLILNSRNGKTIVTENRSESGDGNWLQEQITNGWGDKKKFCIITVLGVVWLYTHQVTES